MGVKINRRKHAIASLKTKRMFRYSSVKFAKLNANKDMIIPRNIQISGGNDVSLFIVFKITYRHEFKRKG